MGGLRVQDIVLSVKSDFVILFAGIIAGFVSEIGAAGSIIALPMLISLGIPPVIANGTNRVANFSLYTSAYGYYVYKKHEFLVPKYLFSLSIPIVVGAVVGSIAANLISDTATHSIVVALSILFITFNTKTAIREDLVKTTVNIKLTALHFLVLFGAGFYGGLIQSGMTYIIFYSLANIILIDYNTSKYLKFFFSVLVTIVSLIVFVFYSNIDYRVGVILLIGGAVGGWIGSIKMQKWSPRHDKEIIKLVILFSILYLMLFILRYGQNILFYA
ncbi:MAG: sulfite exporter TauE/SafE family protein [Rikenellaceae bacterium]